MEQQEMKKIAGVDIGRQSIQFSIYDEDGKCMEEESFPLMPEEQEEYMENGLDRLKKYMALNHLSWSDYASVNFALEDTADTCREKLDNLLEDSFHSSHAVTVVTRFRAFVEYVFHQERAVWERNTILFHFSNQKLTYIMVEQLRSARQKAYRAVQGEIPLEEHNIDLSEGTTELDYNFSRMMKHFLVKHPAHIIYLTGEGFEGNWMKRTLTYLCAGRRVFLGQNLYANGACLMGLGPIPFMEDGMLLMDGPDMVRHTIGLIIQEGTHPAYIPVTSIGKEWYNTQGTVDIILDKSHKVEFFYHNTKNNEMVSSVCEIKDLPERPPKTTRIRIQVQFTSAGEGIILLTDLGFGSLYPATGKVTVFPFQLIS